MQQRNNNINFRGEDFRKSHPHLLIREKRYHHPDVQSVMFRKTYENKRVWNKKSAKKWLKGRFKPIKKVHETKNFLRYRITSPLTNGQSTYKRYETHTVSPTQYLILGYK